MEERIAKNLCRQLQGIIVKADELKVSENFYMDFEGFVSYSEEIKRFISVNVSSAEVIEIVKEIPKLSLRKYWFVYFFTSYKWGFRELQLQKSAIWDIDAIKEQYKSIYNRLCIVESTT